MIVVKIQGGLGNQMFQFAIGKILSVEHDKELFLDLEFFNDQEKRSGFTPRKFEISYLNNDFCIASSKIIESFLKPSILNNLQKRIRLSHRKIYQEKSLKFDSSIFEISSPMYVIGYFQSEKYFLNHHDYIKNLFSFKKHESFIFNTILRKINSEISISVHFRRGDYVTDQITNQVHGTCDLDYYLRAFQLVKSLIPNPYFFIFSDDINWVRNSISNWNYNLTFVENNTFSDSSQELFLMSMCSHNIIANSSYSWWGAWLNNNPEKIVVAPVKWFNSPTFNYETIIPDSWIKI